MAKLYMTADEICKSYSEAKNRREQIRILADLNACEVKTIKEILKEAELKLPQGRIPQSKQVKEEINEGMRIKLSEEKIQTNIARLAAKERAKQTPVELTVAEPPQYISKSMQPEKPISREVWMAQRAHDLKAWLMAELAALRPVDVELIQEYNEVCTRC